MPESLGEALSAALRRLPSASARLLPAVAAADERTRLRWQRLLQETAGPGFTAEAGAGALGDASVRALLLVLDRQADAAVISTEDGAATALWRRLEPEPAAPGLCADLYIGEYASDAAGQATGIRFGWVDWQDDEAGAGGESPAHAAARLHAAAAALARAAGVPAPPLLVSFSGAPERLNPVEERFWRTLEARTPAARLPLYSPLFFSQGTLQAGAWLRALRRDWRPRPAPALPVLCVPRLARTEFAAALAAAGGSWAGPFRAGSRHPAARLAPAEAAAPARADATLDWLLRFTAAR